MRILHEDMDMKFRMFRHGTPALALALLLGLSLCSGQEKDDEPLPPPRHSGSTKIGGAIGFTQSFLFLDLDPINAVLKQEGLAEFSNNSLVMLGGQVYGYILLVQNLRAGYIWMNGSMTSQTLTGNVTREVQLSSGYTGLTLDYTIPVVPRLDVSLGMMLGGGNLTFNITRDYGLGKQWDQAWQNFGSTQPADEYSGKMSGSFFIYQPTLNVEFAVFRWLGIRAGAAYNGMAGGEWKRDDKYDLYGVPGDVNAKGWIFNSGIFAGFFLF